MSKGAGSRLPLAVAFAICAALGLNGITSSEGPTTQATARRLTPSVRITAPGADADCSDDVIIVLGNSTDYAAGTSPASIELAWPNVLAMKLNALGTLGMVTVDNQAKPGTTMAVPNPWGVDARWRWVTDIPAILDRYRGVPRRALVFVLAPSVADMQLTGGDVMATVAALDQVLAALRSAAISDVVVLPMNPISERSLAIFALVDINARIAQFNAALAARGLLTAYRTSPLVGAEPPAGDPIYYDDFLLPDPNGGEARPDYLHIDADGHAHIAGRLIRELPRLLSTICAN